MVTIDIDQSSLAQVIKQLKLKQGQAENKVKAGLKAGALLITNEAKELVPVLTGSLKRSIHDEPIKIGSSMFSTLIGSNLDYAEKIEFGGSRKAPQGYMRPALDTKGEGAINEIKESLMILLR